ncbi:MAG: PEP-CTERM sorting domain-containing protein [Phycisphaerae bacterium]|nr:PEP-CTERM sorting domain-containing protein [Phycisphaerae bacterium]
MRTRIMLTAAVAMLLTGQVMGSVVGGAELFLDANNTASWYGGPTYGLTHQADLPNSDTWWNLNTSDAYGHNLGDITNADGSNVPITQPGAYLGYNGSSLDLNTRRSYNPAFVAGTGGASNYFDGWCAGDNGYRFTMNRSPDRRTDVTWEVWYRLSDTYTSASPYIMANENYGAREGFGLMEIKAADTSKRKLMWRVMQTSGESTIISGEYDYDADEWFHIVGTFGSDGVQKLYINGELIDTFTGVVQGNSVADNPLGLLYRPGDPRPSAGDLAIVRIYHDVLDDNEVIQNFNADAEMFGHEIIPEPATMSLLAVGITGVLFRRKNR